MGISLRLILIFAILLGLLGSVVVTMNLLADSSNRMANSELQRFESRKLADELRQSSDDLTRMARTYVVTGDEIYETYFYDILSIRNGTLPRPKKYDGIYWDYVTSTYVKTGALGERLALTSLMKEIGITSREMVKLQEALGHSDSLAEMEKRAFAAMKGLFVDDHGKFTIDGDPNPEFALKLLYSNRYHSAKADIMRPIGEFFALVDERTLSELENNRVVQSQYRLLTAVLTFITIGFSVLSFFHLKARFVGPVVELSEVAERIRSGAIHERAVIDTDDELGNLASAFNDMNDRIGEERLSSIDGLTQIPNRRRFDEGLDIEWKRYVRQKLPLSLIMIDVDFFKRFNDAAGHLAGDDCLKSVSYILEKRIQRAGDLVARYGGEEFAVILPDTDIKSAEKFAKEICGKIEEAKIFHPDSSVSPYVTVSVGVGSIVPSRDKQPTDLILMADAALYQAKDSGRNCVKINESRGAEPFV